MAPFAFASERDKELKEFTNYFLGPANKFSSVDVPNWNLCVHINLCHRVMRACVVCKCMSYVCMYVRCQKKKKKKAEFFLAT